MLAETLSLAYPGIPASRCELWAPVLNAVCEEYFINTVMRKATMLAQVGHESGRLRYTREIWGPTAQQLRYERDFNHPWALHVNGERHRNTLPFTLGNYMPGDGLRYAGRGPLQVTGRANYALLTQRLRDRFGWVPDFEADPKLLELPEWGALALGDYWERRKLNAFADNQDFVGQTRAINGGVNGLAARQKILAAAVPAVLLTLEY